MDDFMLMQVLHALRNLFRPRHKPNRRDNVIFFDDFMEWPIRTVLHDDAKDRRLGTHAPIQAKN